MKTADIKTGVAYVTRSGREVVLVLDPKRQYVPNYAWGRKHVYTPRESGGTHVLALEVYRYSLGAEDAWKKSLAAAAAYTLGDYRNGVNPPEGWIVGTVTPGQINVTWEEQLVAEEAARKAAVEHSARMSERIAEADESAANIIKALKARGIATPPMNRRDRTVTLSFEDVLALLGLV